MTAKQNRPTFSLFIPQAGLSYSMLRDRAQLLEELGFDGIWLVDHFWAEGAPDLDFLEGWTSLAALAEATERLRIGLLVSCNSYRNPALLAKMAATVDHISQGRLELGIGAGWMESEYKAYGYEFPSMGKRLAQLGEALEIITSMLGKDRSSFEGKHYQVRDAPCAPKPVQSPLPICIGGAGEKVLLRLAARYAQRWNCPMDSAHDIPRLRGVLETHCNEVGTNVDDIIVSEQTVVVMGADRDGYQMKRGLADMMIGSFAKLDKVAILGTPQDVIAGIRKKIEGGVSDFTILFGDMGMDDTLELFAKEVLPAFRD